MIFQLPWNEESNEFLNNQTHFQYSMILEDRAI